MVNHEYLRRKSKAAVTLKFETFPQQSRSVFTKGLGEQAAQIEAARSPMNSNLRLRLISRNTHALERLIGRSLQNINS